MWGGRCTLPISIHLIMTPSVIYRFLPCSSSMFLKSHMLPRLNAAPLEYLCMPHPQTVIHVIHVMPSSTREVSTNKTRYSRLKQCQQLQQPSSGSEDQVQNLPVLIPRSLPPPFRPSFLWSCGAARATGNFGSYLLGLHVHHTTDYSFISLGCTREYQISTTE
jgi:hypothetical protein